MVKYRPLLAAVSLGAAAILGSASAEASGFSTCDQGKAPAASVADQNGNEIATYCGRFNSSGGDDVSVFQGIEYATQVRFRSPEIVTPSGTDIPAKNFAAVCPQEVQQSIIGKEDCLYLNIWAPSAASRNPNGYPVLVFIHGGAFVIGSSADGSFDPANFGAAGFNAEGGLYDGTSLARQGIVVVTLNYRLGALGFVTYDPPDSKSWIASPVTGNFGIQDVLTALQWVASYIDGFGGDAATMTIAGESAGAMTVGLLNYSSPAANGMIAGAIMESNPMAIQYEDGSNGLAGLKHHQLTGHAFLGSLCQNYAGSIGMTCDGSGDAHDIKGTDWVTDGVNGHPAPAADQFVQSQGYASLSAVSFVANPKFSNLLPWTPYLDTKNASELFRFTADQPRRGYDTGAGYTAHPVLYGTNRNEGVLFIDVVSSYVTPFLYNGILRGLFDVPEGSQTDLVQIIQPAANTDFGNDAVQPYCAGSSLTDKVDCTEVNGFIGRSAADAFANVVTDFVFRCANDFSGQASAGAGAYVKPYIFANSPVRAMFANPKSGVSPCNATTPNADLGGIAVCHGYELPFVFGTLDSVYNPAVVRPSNERDEATSSDMVATWAQFVLQAGSGLKPSVSGAQEAASRFGDQDAFPSDAGSLLDAANCGPSNDLWTKQVVPIYE